MERGTGRKFDRGGGRGWRGNYHGRNRFHNSNYQYYESYEGTYDNYQGSGETSKKDESQNQNYDNYKKGSNYYYDSGYEQDYKPRGRGGRRGDYRGNRGGYRSSRGRQRRNEYWFEVGDFYI